MIVVEKGPNAQRGFAIPVQNWCARLQNLIYVPNTERPLPIYLMAGGIGDYPVSIDGKKSNGCILQRY